MGNTGNDDFCCPPGKTMDRIPGLNEKEFLLERAIATLLASGISEAEARRMVLG